MLLPKKTEYFSFTFEGKNHNFCYFAIHLGGIFSVFAMGLMLPCLCSALVLILLTNGRSVHTVTASEFIHKFQQYKYSQFSVTMKK
jgi:hypothetical protein